MSVVDIGRQSFTTDVSRKPVRVPMYLWFLTALTMVYLLVEVPFAAYLVNLLGSDAGHEEIERSEQVGRIISGVALALAVWGWQIPHFRRKRSNILYAAGVCIVTAVLCVGTVYYGEKALIDQIAASATVEKRQQALSTLAVRNELFSEGVTGVDHSSIEPSDGPWLAFVGLFPFLSMQDTDVLDRAVTGREDVVAAAVERAVPGIDDFRTIGYETAMDVWKQRFNAYRQAGTERARAIVPIEKRIEDGWNKHVRNMEYRSVIGSRRASRQGVQQVVSDVQNAGVPVPDNWKPTDQVTFQRAAYSTVMPEIDGAYNSAISEIVGDGAKVKPGIDDFETFLSEGAVQEGLWRDLGLVDYDGVVIPGMSGASFDRLYHAYSKGFIRELSAVYLSDPSELARDGKFDEVAQAAVRSVWAPVLAITFSLLGAAGHILKLTNYLAVIALSKMHSRRGIAALFRRNFILRMTGIVSLASVLVMTTYVPANAIVTSPYYIAASQGVKERFGPQVEQGLAWTISLQKALVPAGTAARSVGIFLPLENYLVGSPETVVQTAYFAPIAEEIPLPLPRLVRAVDTAAVDSVAIPLPRPRPDRH